MASNQTERYGLSQWEKSDKVLMEDFNADNAKLDAALAAQAEAMEDKADVTALEALARTVNTLSGTVSGQSSTLSRKGNCQIYYSTYVGAGPYGSAHPSRLTFPGRPLLVFIADGKGADFLALLPGGLGVNVNNNSYYTPITWGSNYVSWYNNQSADIQKCGSNTTYHVVALLAVD